MRHRPPEPVLYWDSAYYARARQRAAIMADTAICDWIGTAVSGMYKAMRDFRATASADSLAEMQEGLVAAYALLGELRARRETAARELDAQAHEA